MKDKAPRWRAALSLALSIALHATLLVLFLRPAPPPASTGRLDVVTVYLRDSRVVAESPMAQRASTREPSRAFDERPAVAASPTPRASGPSASTRVTRSVASREAKPARPSRATEAAAIELPRTPDTVRAKPSPLDQQGNRAHDSSSQYLRGLAERLSQVKNYPKLAVALREEGTVLLSFQIDRDGHLLAWSIASSSGHDDLDREVARMIAEAAPFPPFPPSWLQSEKAFQVPIGFYLH